MSEDKGDRAGGLFNDIEARPGADEAPKRCSCRLLGKVGIVLILVIVVAGVIANKARRKEAPGPPATATQFARETVLASVNGEEITLGELEGRLDELPPQHRAAFEHEKHEFLEELIARELLLQEARKLRIAETEAYSAAIREHAPQPGHVERVLIDLLLRNGVLDKVNVSDADLRSFYEEHKAEIPGDPLFEDAKDLLRSSLLQQKQYEAVEQYLAALADKADITRNEAWAEAQQMAAADNPLDNALKSGRPVVADFGRGKCVPCKMMKPILDDLAGQYQGRAEILIIEIDDYPALTRRCGIRAIPTQIFYDGTGEEVYRHQGFMPREDIVAQLERLGVK